MLVFGGPLFFYYFLVLRLQIKELAIVVTICVGLALVLWAFGSSTDGKWNGFKISGAGALVFPLVWLIMSYTYTYPCLTKTGSVYIPSPYFAKVSELLIFDDQQLHEYRDSKINLIHFVMLKEKFSNPRVYVKVYTVEKGPGKSFEMFGDGEEIIARHVGKNWGDSAQWILDYPKRIIKDGESIIFQEAKDKTEDVVPPKPLKKASLSSYLLLKSSLVLLWRIRLLITIAL
jgi:hypothetical protein